MRKYVHTITGVVLFLLLVYTRFGNLGWGLPYPMHPDERNMADAIIRMRCDKPAELITGLVTYAPRNVMTYLTLGEFALPDMKVECFNPHFFAYGQLSLFAGYALANAAHGFGKLMGDIPQGAGLNFSEAVMGLRVWSALASALIPLVLLQILLTLNPIFKKRIFKYGALTCFIFSPILIQFAHFGTTEAVLMLWYSILTYLAIVAVRQKKVRFIDLALMAIVCGLAIATKISSLLYLAIPLMIILLKATTTLLLTIRSFHTSYVIATVPPPAATERSHGGHSAVLSHMRGRRGSPVEEGATKQSHHLILIIFTWLRFILTVGIYVLFTTILAGIVSFIFSPHNIISLRELLGSMHYEGDVGLGKVIPFYTRQFLLEQPFVFQLNHIFPFVLGLPVFIAFCMGFLVLPYNRSYNTLRFAILSYAVLTISWYAKWTRFIAPIYPLMLVMAMLLIADLYRRFGLKRWSTIITYRLGIVVLLLFTIPGIAFFSVYTERDVRFVASDWVYKHIPPQSYVLSETANVIDIPIPDVSKKQNVPNGYNIQYLSFNSYEVDVDPALQKELKEAVVLADYIFVPSRRVFYNHTCVGLDGKITTTRHSAEKCTYLARTYPVLKKYYEDLFSGKSGFQKVAEFTSYPRLELFGRTILEFPDESAEETFTVFDHPVMRIYQRRSGK